MANDEVVAVKEKADIVAIIGERVVIKKAGRNFKGLCPFHGEKSPSFFVSPEMQMYKCFGCQAAGDVIAFLEAYEGWSFRETLEVLAKRVGVTLTPYRSTGEEDKIEKLREILHLAAEYYHYLLMEHEIGKNAQDYLKSRGVHQQSMKDFMMGYSLSSWDGLQKFLVQKKKYAVEDLEAVGMVIKAQVTSYKSQDTSQKKHYYDRFRGRIMFPLKDFAGHLVGFSGRVLEQDVAEAKYINSPETVLYHKSECLFGLSQARQAIRKMDRVVVVEGEMDVILSHQVGVKEVVAVKGSALTEAQVLHLRKLTKQVVLSMDADEAGQEAIKRGIEVADKQGMNLAVIKVEGGKDPADLVLKEPQSWKEISRNTTPVYQYFMDWAFTKFDTSSGTGQKEISAYLAPLWAKIENGVERAYYVKKLAERLGVGVQTIEDEMIKVERQIPIKTRTVKTLPSKNIGRREKVERFVVALALQFEEPADVWQGINSENLAESYLQRLVVEVNKLLALNKQLTNQQLMRQLPMELQQLAQDLYGSDNSLWRMNEDDLAETMKKALHELDTLVTREEMQLVLGQLSGEEELEDSQKEALLSKYRTLATHLKSLS